MADSYKECTAFQTMVKGFDKITKNPPYGISVDLLDPNDPTIWIVNMKGPVDTLYEHNTFKLEFMHRDRFKPPIVKFIERVPMHPNIGEDGTICLDILTEERYSPALYGPTVLMSIQSLLSEPNPHECVRSNLGALLLKDPDTYNAVIRMHCQGDDLLFNEHINDKSVN